MTRRGAYKMRALALVTAVLIASPSWVWAVTGGPELPNPGHTMMSKQEQIQMGQQATAQVYQQMPVLPDNSPVTQYVQQLGRKLVAVIPADKTWPYQFHVIPQKEINAFALPGGNIFVNVGTITAADNEAELAGVMAHEMSHVYMQHSAKQATTQGLAQGVLGVLGSVLGGGTAGNVARAGIQLGAGAYFLKYSRGDEAQADSTGAIIMYKAGYDPKAMAQFFQKLEQQGGAGGPQFLSDHPNPGNRVAAVTKEIQDWPPKNFAVNGPQFAPAKQQASSIKVYTAQQIADGAKNGQWAKQNKQTGATPKNLPATPASTGGAASNGTSGSGTLASVSWDQIKPSGDFKPLNAGAFTISYPSNWQTSSDQNAGVTIAPAAGAAQGTVAYGAVINGAQIQNASSIDDATQQLIQGLQQSNPGMQVSGSATSITVSGTEGRSVTLKSQSPLQKNGQPLPERDWLVTVPSQQSGGILYAVFIAPDSDFGKLQSTYDKMVKSWQVK